MHFRAFVPFHLFIFPEKKKHKQICFGLSPVDLFHYLISLCVFSLFSMRPLSLLTVGLDRAYVKTFSQQTKFLTTECVITSNHSIWCGLLIRNSNIYSQPLLIKTHRISIQHYLRQKPYTHTYAVSFNWIGVSGARQREKHFHNWITWQKQTCDSEKRGQSEKTKLDDKSDVSECVKSRCVRNTHYLTLVTWYALWVCSVQFWAYRWIMITSARASYDVHQFDPILKMFRLFTYLCRNNCPSIHNRRGRSAEKRLHQTIDVCSIDFASTTTTACWLKYFMLFVVPGCFSLFDNHSFRPMAIYSDTFHMVFFAFSSMQLSWANSIFFSKSTGSEHGHR